MMSMFKPGLIGAVFLVFAAQAPAQAAEAQTAQIARPMVTERVSAGRQVLEIDMSALADPAPRFVPRLAAATVAAPASAEPAATVTGTPMPRKRFAHKVGQYEDAPLVALLGSPN